MAGERVRAYVRVALIGSGLFLTGAGCDKPAANGAASVPPAAPPPTQQRAAGFDAARAFRDLEAQCAFGPRVPGSAGHRKTRDWLLTQFAKHSDRAFLQDFTKVIRGRRLPMSNIVAQINPDAPTQVMLCAHWDTRPTADMEIDPARQVQPIAGANDGASGVAVLLELARLLHAKRPAVGVQFVLFDGEDYGPGIDNMFLGARHYARKPALPKPRYAILIDMIGDKDLEIYREKNSQNNAPEINDKVWNAARALGIAAFKEGVRHDVQDDHIPLQRAGWKAIDLIDFDYAPWHTLDDTPDKCSPASLKAVGDVLAHVVYSEK